MCTKKVSCELHEQDVPLVWMMSRRIPGSYGDRYRRYMYLLYLCTCKVQIFYFKILNFKKINVRFVLIFIFRKLVIICYAYVQLEEETFKFMRMFMANSSLAK